MKKYELQFRVKTSLDNPREKARELVQDPELDKLFKTYGFTLRFPEEYFEEEQVQKNPEPEKIENHNHTCKHSYNCKSHRDICVAKYGMKIL